MRCIAVYIIAMSLPTGLVRSEIVESTVTVFIQAEFSGIVVEASYPDTAECDWQLRQHIFSVAQPVAALTRWKQLSE